MKPMAQILAGFAVLHAFTALFFVAAWLLLLLIAGRTFWAAATGGFDLQAAELVIESIGLIAIAIVALQMSQTVVEEEVARTGHVSTPSRIRRFVSRFLVVAVVALAIEGLVATFKAIHGSGPTLVESAALVVAAGTLLAGWGAFLWLNKAVEQLEPDAIEAVKREDTKFEKKGG
jgi:hypothetical protein